jgi:hypothetical protein
VSEEAQDVRDSLAVARWYIAIANCCVDRVAAAPDGCYLGRARHACTVVRCLLLQPHLTETDHGQIQRDLSEVEKRIAGISTSRGAKPAEIAKAKR